MWTTVLGRFSPAPSAHLTIRCGEWSLLRSDVWLLITRMMGMKGVSYAFKFSN